MALTGPYYWNGTTFPTQGGKPVLITEAEFVACCCLPAACPCDAAEWAALVAAGTPCHSLVQCYRIKDYVDGDLIGCIACPASANPAWDGTLYARSVSCTWDDNVANKSIDGRRFATGFLGLAAGEWTLYVKCYEATTDKMIWLGGKAVGSTPVGIYTFQSSFCADGQPDTLEIEECP